MNRKAIGTLMAVAVGMGIVQFWRARQDGSADTLPEPGQRWTAADIPDLTGRVVLVTGANSGIGFEAAKEFARKDAQVILACRNLEKAEGGLAQIKAEIPGAAAEIMQLDLASLASIRQLASTFKNKYRRLDLLVNNAGIMMVPYGLTEDGFERQFGTNHLGHFALTGLLFDLLTNTPGSRVVNVSSTGHRFGQMDFDNLLFEEGQGYSPTRAYGRSKLANLLFTNELQRRFDVLGVPSLALSAHPGGSNTNLARHLEERWVYKLSRPFIAFMMQSAAMGALPTLRAAVDPAARGGQYYGPGGFMEQQGYPVVVEASEAAHNLADARRLWQVSEQLTGVEFG